MTVNKSVEKHVPSAQKLRGIVAEATQPAKPLVLTEAIDPDAPLSDNSTVKPADLSTQDLVDIVRDTTEAAVAKCLPSLLKAEVEESVQKNINAFASSLSPVVRNAIDDAMPLALNNAQLVPADEFLPARVAELVRAQLSGKFGVELTGKMRKLIREELDSWLDEA